VFNSLKISLAFLVTGIVCAVFSDPVITFFTQSLKPEYQDRFRSLNDFIFVVIIAFVLYFEIKRHERALTWSEEEYRHLFESNPNPMWIYDNETLRFIKVNHAAIEKYQYSHDRFLKMTIYDIRPSSDHGKLQLYLNENQDSVQVAGVWRHMKANGDIFNVSIISYPVFFDDKRCSLVMSTDVSQILENERKLQEAYQKIKMANAALVQINWSNSHELRKPLCSILGLIDLLKKETSERERNEMLGLMEKCSWELDEVLKHNSNKVTRMEVQEIA